MHGISICETCKKEYKWRRANNCKKPRFCCFKCRSYVGLKTKKKNSELTEEENFNRIKQYYEKYVVKQDGCWTWKGTIEHTGYAKLSIRPPIKAHRASYIIHKGPIPKGLLVLHTCDVRDCTNPEHLWLGTHKQNTQDKIKKGRSNTAKGSSLKVSKINESQALEIKKMLQNGDNCAEIGRFYGVSRKIISRIKNDETWAHVPWPDAKTP